MRIKPTYEKSYLIRYSRGQDVQTTEVVDANAEVKKEIYVEDDKE